MLKTKVWTVTDDGRDKGKKFIITEMPALKAEDWAYRAILALTHAGVDLPAHAEGSGMAGLATSGLRALQKLDYHEVKPLFQEIMECVQIQPSATVIRPLVMNETEGDDIEEVATLVALRFQWFALHTDFFFAVVKSRQIFGMV